LLNFRHLNLVAWNCSLWGQYGYVTGLDNLVTGVQLPLPPPMNTKKALLLEGLFLAVGHES